MFRSRQSSRWNVMTCSESGRGGSTGTGGGGGGAVGVRGGGGGTAGGEGAWAVTVAAGDAKAAGPGLVQANSESRMRAARAPGLRALANSGQDFVQRLLRHLEELRASLAVTPGRDLQVGLQREVVSDPLAGGLREDVRNARDAFTGRNDHLFGGGVLDVEVANVLLQQRPRVLVGPDSRHDEVAGVERHSEVRRVHRFKQVQTFFMLLPIEG